MLLRFRYKDFVTNQIEYVESFTPPTLSLGGNIIKPNTLTVVPLDTSTANTATLTSIDVTLTGNAEAVIAPLSIGSYRVKVNKKPAQGGAPTAQFDIAKTFISETAQINDIINIESDAPTANQKEFLKLFWRAGESLKLVKNNPINSPSINTYNGVYNVVIM